MSPGTSRLTLPVNETSPASRVPLTGGHPGWTPRVLVVDDAAAGRELLRRLLSRDGCCVDTARDGASALARIAQDPPDVVLLDVRMPGLTGLEVCRRLKRDPVTRLTPVVLVTGLDSRQDRIEGIDAGADDFLSKPVDPSELLARVRSLTRLKHYTDQLDSAEAILVNLALAVEARDPCTVGHCLRLAKYAMRVGVRLDLDADDVEALRRGGFLHDIGKVGVPDSVLLKPGTLTTAERELMQQHTTIGDVLCRGLKSLHAVRPIVRHHHERLDGSGYPDGLRGDAIPLLAQVTGIVDVYDALTTDRPYRAAESPERACRKLVEDVRRGWRRSDLVQTFVDLVSTGQLNDANS